MTTAIKKRTRLTGMKYNRVDYVPDGANQFADILLAKSKEQTVSKAMGTVKCNSCGARMGTQYTKCKSCGSTNLSKIRVTVTKTVAPVKPEPKNDSSNKKNKSKSFEDTQLDRDNSANGSYVDAGDSMDDAEEDNSVNKKMQKSRVKIHKDGVQDVDNTVNEKRNEGEDDDEDIENLAEKTQATATPRSGFKNTSSTTSDSTKAFKKARKGSSQVDAESAEQMYRENSEENDSDDSQDNSRAKVAKKKRTVTRSVPKSVFDTGNKGVYNGLGNDKKLKNGYVQGGRPKTTNGSRTGAPPQNKLDKSRRVVKSNRALSTVEALNLSVGLAENLTKIIKSGSWNQYPAVMEDFVNTLNVCADTWASNTAITKGNSRDAQLSNIEKRINKIVKASLGQQMSDEASAGKDPDDVHDEDISNKPEKVDAGDDTGMVNKSKKEDIFKGLHPDVKAQLIEAADIIEKNKVREWEQEAAQFASIPGTDVVKLAKALRTTKETDEGAYATMIQTLNAAKQNLNDGAIFKQIGRAGGNSTVADDPMERAYAYANERISKGANGQTREQLVAEYIKDPANRSDFYKDAVSAR